MVDGPLLPIKVVFPHERDYRSPPSGGGDLRLFGPVTDDVRNNLVGQVAAVGNFFALSFKSMPEVAAVARVKLKAEAVAKTHRPYDLFNPDTCPIIGGG